MKRSLICAAILALLAVSPGLGDGSLAHRLTDKQVKTLLDDIRTELADFEDSMDPQVRKSILRSQLGETDVEAFFKDLGESRDKAENRLGYSYSASTEVATFLRQASAFEVRSEAGWSLYGAEGSWKSLRPMLVRLANAYGIDWTADPGTWRSRRKSDGEIQDFIDALAANVTSFRKVFQKDLKRDKSLSKQERKTLVARAMDLEDKAAGLSQGFRKTKSVDTGATRLEASVVLFEEALGDRELTAGSAAAWAGIRESLATLNEEFDLPPVS